MIFSTSQQCYFFIPNLYKPKYFCLLGDQKFERSGASQVGGRQHPPVESKFLLQLEGCPSI